MMSNQDYAGSRAIIPLLFHQPAVIGGQRFIAKPVDMRGLLERLDEFFNDRSSPAGVLPLLQGGDPLDGFPGATDCLPDGVARSGWRPIMGGWLIARAHEPGG